MSPVSKNIIAALAYFDMFEYPLTKVELYSFLGAYCDKQIFNKELSYLLISENVYCFDNFFTLKNNAKIALRRHNGNKKATEMMKIAERIGQLLIRFPYVRGIAVSGSLSKNFADEKSDIDLFVITAPGRLWVARTLMHLFKKFTFLFNKEHFFCMNYFIDEAGLQIIEKNIYTATEVVTLIPLEGDSVFKKFFSANAWTLNYLPNNYMRVASAKSPKFRWFKSVIEISLNNCVGDMLNDVLMKITASRWLKKTLQKKLNMRGVIMGMAAAKHYAKPDPQNFQHHMIQRYEQHVATLLQNTDSIIAHV